MKKTLAELLSYEKIYIGSNIDADLAQTVIERLYTGVDPVTLVVSSNGGSIIDATSIGYAVKSAPRTVYLLVTGMCYSSAAIIVSMGKQGYRYALVDSPFFIHRSSRTVDDECQTQQLEDALWSLEHSDSVMMRKMAENTLLEIEEIEELVDANRGFGTNLTAVEAFNFGIIDYIIHPDGNAS